MKNILFIYLRFLVSFIWYNPIWEKIMKYIKKLTDEDFNLKTKEFNNPRYRRGARGVILNSKNEIAILNKSNKNEYKLMEVTDNIGIVTDDIGKMRAVMASSSKDMEDILRRENILEKEKNRLEQINKELKKHKANKYLILAPIFALIIGNAIAFNYVSNRLGPNVELDFKIILAAFGTYVIFVVPTLYPVVKELFTFRKKDFVKR